MAFQPAKPSCLSISSDRVWASDLVMSYRSPARPLGAHSSPIAQLSSTCKWSNQPHSAIPAITKMLAQRRPGPFHRRNSPRNQAPAARIVRTTGIRGLQQKSIPAPANQSDDACRSSRTQPRLQVEDLARDGRSVEMPERTMDSTLAVRRQLVPDDHLRHFNQHPFSSVAVGQVRLRASPINLCF